MQSLQDLAADEEEEKLEGIKKELRERFKKLPESEKRAFELARREADDVQEEVASARIQERHKAVPYDKIFGRLRPPKFSFAGEPFQDVRLSQWYRFNEKSQRTLLDQEEQIEKEKGPLFCANKAFEESWISYLSLTFAKKHKLEVHELPFETLQIRKPMAMDLHLPSPSSAPLTLPSPPSEDESDTSSETGEFSDEEEAKHPNQSQLHVEDLHSLPSFIPPLPREAPERKAPMVGVPPPGFSEIVSKKIKFFFEAFAGKSAEEVEKWNDVLLRGLNQLTPPQLEELRRIIDLTSNDSRAIITEANKLGEMYNAKDAQTLVETLLWFSAILMVLLKQRIPTTGAFLATWLTNGLSSSLVERTPAPEVRKLRPTFQTSKQNLKYANAFAGRAELDVEKRKAMLAEKAYADARYLWMNRAIGGNPERFAALLAEVKDQFIAKEPEKKEERVRPILKDQGTSPETPHDEIVQAPMKRTFSERGTSTEASYAHSGVQTEETKESVQKESSTPLKKHKRDISRVFAPPKKRYTSHDLSLEGDGEWAKIARARAAYWTTILGKTITPKTWNDGGDDADSRLSIAPDRASQYTRFAHRDRVRQLGEEAKTSKNKESNSQLRERERAPPIDLTISDSEPPKEKDPAPDIDLTLEEPPPPEEKENKKLKWPSGNAFIWPPAKGTSFEVPPNPSGGLKPLPTKRSTFLMGAKALVERTKMTVIGGDLLQPLRMTATPKQRDLAQTWLVALLGACLKMANKTSLPAWLQESFQNDTRSLILVLFDFWKTLGFSKEKVDALIGKRGGDIPYSVTEKSALRKWFHGKASWPGLEFQGPLPKSEPLTVGPILRDFFLYFYALGARLSEGDTSEAFARYFWILGENSAPKNWRVHYTKILEESRIHDPDIHQEITHWINENA